MTARQVAPADKAELWPHLLFPSAMDIQAYLGRYAETFGLIERVRLNSRVTGLERTDDGFIVIVESMGELRRYTAPPLHEQFELLRMLASTDTPWAAVLRALSVLEDA